MKRQWLPTELDEHFTLTPPDLYLLSGKPDFHKLAQAALLKYFQYEGRFPLHKNDVAREVLVYLAKQLRLDPDLYLLYAWQGRSIITHRAQIRDYCHFREATDQDVEQLRIWFNTQALRHDQEEEHLKQRIYSHFRELKIEPTTPIRIDRLIRSALHTYEEQFFQNILGQLTPTSQSALEALLTSPTIIAPSVEASNQRVTPKADLPFWQQLKAEPGKPGLETVLTEVTKLKKLRALALPVDLFDTTTPKAVARYAARAATESLRQLRQHPLPIRYTLMAAYCLRRCQEVTDNLVELLIDIIHGIGAKAERKVDKQVVAEYKRVDGKPNLLYKLAQTTADNPKGVIEEVVYKVVSQQTLQDIVKEHETTGPSYRQKVYSVMRGSYGHHYRRMVPELLEVLTFRSNNVLHRPLIQALELLKKYADVDNEQLHYPADEKVPLEGVVKGNWLDLVVERSKRGKHKRVNRIYYEMCVLQTLREQLRCKEIWVEGAGRYRNPDLDVPMDFAQTRQEYYQALNQPLEVADFVTNLQKRMQAALTTLDEAMPTNSHVKIITKKGGGWINLSPLEALPEPAQLDRLKAEVARRWVMPGLLDFLKETDLRVDFTSIFRSAAQRENLDRATLQKRLLLCLYALGTNTGFKSMEAGELGEKYRDLMYVKDRFITKNHLREAIVAVCNAIFRARLPTIWGEGTTACASDSKKFGAWDQNLLTEWHVRYRGRGVVIYWHVEKHSTCIYSQLKSCSSSEVAAMIEGVLRHCTEMSVDRNYVDTHGQSEVGFAFCHLLGFQLMPRMKNIYSQKLYRPETGKPEAYPNLQKIMTRPINWDLIRQQYDEMVKFATALRLGTAQTEDILRRFRRNNLIHPTYQALAELGKVIKTIFLCEYLNSPEMRQEIHGGLNTVENWNSANSFIHYGKSGEFHTNVLAEQEISMLALHLLQISLVYINTLMLQRVLGEKDWLTLMKAEDMRALSPLIYRHVNPYGLFQLDLSTRLAIEEDKASLKNRKGSLMNDAFNPNQSSISATTPIGILSNPVARTSAKKKAHEMAQQLRGERPDYAYLKDVFRYLRAELEVTVPKASHKLPYIPSEAEIQCYYRAVWQAENFSDMVLIKLLLYTGVRVSELCNIYLTAVDFEQCQIRITAGKGPKDRMVPFPASFKEALAMHTHQLKERGAHYLFESSWKKKYTERGVRKILERYSRSAGLAHTISPHKLRHFLLTWLKKQGIDDALIQPYSGHASRQALEIYSKLALVDAQREYNQVIGRFPI